MGVDHAERGEDLVPGEGAERFAADAFDDLGQQREAGVAVEVTVAGSEVEFLHAGDHPQDILVADHVVAHAPAGEGEQRPLVAETAGVVEQVAYGDGLAEVGEFGDVFADGVVEAELAALLQQDDAGGDELLGDRGYVEDAVGGERDVVVEVGHAVGAGQDGAAVAVDGDGATGRAGLVPGGEEGVDAVGRGIGRDREG